MPAIKMINLRSETEEIPKAHHFLSFFWLLIYQPKINIRSKIVLFLELQNPYERISTIQAAKVGQLGTTPEHHYKTSIEALQESGHAQVDISS